MRGIEMRKGLCIFTVLIMCIGLLRASAAGAVSPALKQCRSDLATCNADLTACEAGAQVFPGDGAGDGPALSYTDNLDGTATDNNTKFIWEIKLALDGSDGGNCNDPDQPDRSVHCVNNLYNWSSTATAADGTLFTVFLDTLNNKCDGDETTACTSNADCVGIGNGLCGHAGHSDWCIPSVKKLQSIVDYGEFVPAIDPSFPGETAASDY